MKTKAKVRNYGSGRKIVELPKAVRDNFKDKEVVTIEKLKNETNN